MIGWSGGYLGGWDACAGERISEADGWKGVGGLVGQLHMFSVMHVYKYACMILILLTYRRGALQRGRWFLTAILLSSNVNKQKNVE